MTIPCFSSLEELQLVLGEDISITFFGDEWPFLSFINTVTESKDPPRFRIVIGAIPDHFENLPSRQRGSDLLEDQKITLLHELTHIFHYLVFGQGFGRGQGAFGLEGKEYERAIDEEIFKIVRQNNELLVAIVLELTAHPKCSWKYEVTNTPFYYFHRDLILSHLSSQAGRLQFGDPKQIKLLDLLREMQA